MHRIESGNTLSLWVGVLQPKPAGFFGKARRNSLFECYYTLKGNISEETGFVMHFIISQLSD